VSLLDDQWFVVGPPWGDGTWINAGSEDPHGGQFVVDCEAMLDAGPRGEVAAELAAHSVRLHGAYLRAKARTR
jgi:hypothetical protein